MLWLREHAAIRSTKISQTCAGSVIVIEVTQVYQASHAVFQLAMQISSFVLSMRHLRVVTFGGLFAANEKSNSQTSSSCAHSALN
eukprot:m.407053 g.407053  ORF g.407053 m.407053 type:complete len:85 (-) comp16795_c6_seq4:221-475(-)